jgi:cytochrome c biogenesis protein CcdA/thiol-disulfide isomerase/thioredoxin
MEIVLAAIFALVAGAGTAVSPCVLPVLPLALSGAATGGRRRPFGIAVGLAASFAFITLAFAYVVAALGLPDDLLRTVAIVSLLVFGLALAIPPLSDRLEGWLSRMVPQKAGKRAGEGFGSGVLLGATLGPLYLPCAGPILTAVISVQASQDLSAQRLTTGLAYALGTAVGVFVVLTAGRKLLGRLRSNAGRQQQGMGVVMILFGVITLTGADNRFRTEIADALPAWLVSPTDGLEKTTAVTKSLGLKPVKSGLKDGGPAPEFNSPGPWINSKPLTMAGLRGRVVLIDFWTYTCINCIRTQPYLKAWDAKYRKDGLTIVGVHSPEFGFEKDQGNVERAVEQAGLKYPVVNDSDMGTWNAWGNQYWPAEYLVDAKGHVRYASFGEGDYDATEKAIQGLLAEAGRDAKPAADAPVKAITPSRQTQTPETYLGTDRAQGYVQDPLKPGGRDFGPAPAKLQSNQFAYSGVWKLTGENATAIHDAGISVNYVARRVYLVLGPTAGPADVEVYVDGEKTRTVHDDHQGLYTLVDGPRVESHTLSLKVPDGIEGFAFTFG